MPTGFSEWINWYIGGKKGLVWWANNHKIWMIFLKLPRKDVRDRIFYFLVLILRVFIFYQLLKLKYYCECTCKYESWQNENPHAEREKSSSRGLNSWYWFKLQSLALGRFWPIKVKCNLDKSFLAYHNLYIHYFKILQGTYHFFHKDGFIDRLHVVS